MTKAAFAFARTRCVCCAFSVSVTRSRGTKLIPRMVSGCSDRSWRVGGLHNLWSYLLRQPSTSCAERRRIPGVDEVGVPAVQAAGRERYALAAADGVAEQRRERRYRDGMAGWTLPLPHVGHVALVVRAIEMSAIPALREDNVEMEGFTARAGEHVRRVRDGREEAAIPERHAHALRTRCARVSGDHAQTVWEGVDRCEGEASVVDRRQGRQDQLRSLVQSGNPIRGPIGGTRARCSARRATMRRSRKRSSSGFRRTCGNGRGPACRGRRWGRPEPRG